ILMVLLTTLSCRAQIIAVEDFENYNQELSEGTHVKDVNNLLDKYVGTWKGTYDSKNYEFMIIKYTRTSNNRNLKFDKLLMRYKITDSSNNIIVNTLDLPNGDIYIVRGSYLSSSGGYKLSYQGLDAECGQNGTIYISAYGANHTKLQLFLMVSGEIHDCSSGNAEQIMPMESMELIKQ
ncbi:hypothetical protein N9Q68_01110, partial [Polaribacter sp.]|nr:hypothetical protein [Polaribacter sp.]